MNDLLVAPHNLKVLLHHIHALSANKLTPSATLSSQHSLVTSIHASVADPSWHDAMEEEYDALIANNTWDLFAHLVGSNVIPEKWIPCSLIGSTASTSLSMG
jgi:hypothetical protein